MAQRKAAAAEAAQPAEEAAPASQPAESPSQPAARQYRANPYPIKTADLDGFKIRLQESRPPKVGDGHGDDAPPPAQQPWQKQIKFGSGAVEDRPSDAVIDFIKSHKITVDTMEGSKQVSQFRWNGQERAWAMKIDYDAPATSRRKAEQVFDDVVRLVAAERGVTRQR